MQKALAREVPMNANPATALDQPSSLAPVNILYNPEDGFRVFWDYATNLPRKAKGLNLARTKIVYCMYNGTVAYSRVKATKWYETEKAGQAMCEAVFAMAKAFPKVSPFLKLNLILEIQFTAVADGISSANPVSKSLGWTALPLFKDSPTSQDPVLSRGNFKLPLRIVLLVFTVKYSLFLNLYRTLSLPVIFGFEDFEM